MLMHNRFHLGLKRLSWEKTELAERRKGDRAKVKLAKQLRQETAMTLRWIAQRLEMGSWTDFRLLDRLD